MASPGHLDFYVCGAVAQQLVAVGRRAVATRELQIETISLDLNLTQRRVDIDDRVHVDDQVISLEPLATIGAESRKVLRAMAPSAGQPISEWEPVAVFDEHFYQLVATDEAPTLEIDGIQMHLTTNGRPFESASAFAETVVRPGMRVLDTCGGLGYCALHAVRCGADHVTSCEISSTVVQLRASNPWSPTDVENLTVEVGDVFRASTRLEPGSFDAVVHDPPRLALAPELYSESFYLRLWDLLRPGGRLFHYTGDPGSRRSGSRLPGQVRGRLRRIGFEVDMRPELQGMVAERGAKLSAGAHL